jgi:hypothetical protein
LELQNPPAEGEQGTNCLDCEMYKKLGEVCVVEHGKRFLWEYCKDFRPEVKLSDYNELMRTVRKEIAIERKKNRQKKKRELALLKKDESKSKKARKSVDVSKRGKLKIHKAPKKEPESATIEERKPSPRSRSSLRAKEAHITNDLSNKSKKKKIAKQLTLGEASQDSNVTAGS